MTTIHSRHARGLLAGSAVVMIAALIGSAASATELQGQQTVSNHQHLDQAKGEDGQPLSPMTATAYGLYGVNTGDASTGGATLTLDGNHQSAEIAGNAATSTLTVRTVRAEGGSYDESTPFAVLANRQSGDGTVQAISGMTVSVPGEIGGSSVTLSNNANVALSRMNDASNSLSVEAVDLAGDARLTSKQRAAGNVTATATSSVGIGNPDVAVQASRLTIQGNSAETDATANHVSNSLSVASATGFGGTPMIDSRQHNDAGVTSATDTFFTISGSGAYRSALSIDGNAATSLARGNSADNRMNVAAGSGYSGGVEPVLARAQDTSSTLVSAPAGAVLSNRQFNTGEVASRTSITAGAALNCGCTDESRIGVTAHTGATSAYGNAALNAMTGDGRGQPVALVSNVQVNRGPVSAAVTGQFGTIMTGGVNASMVTVSGNSLAATAIGNQAVNSLTFNR